MKHDIEPWQDRADKDPLAQLRSLLHAGKKRQARRQAESLGWFLQRHPERIKEWIARCGNETDPEVSRLLFLALGLANQNESRAYLFANLSDPFRRLPAAVALAVQKDSHAYYTDPDPDSIPPGPVGDASVLKVLTELAEDPSLDKRDLAELIRMLSLSTREPEVERLLRTLYVRERDAEVHRAIFVALAGRKDPSTQAFLRQAVGQSDAPAAAVMALDSNSRENLAYLWTRFAAADRDQRLAIVTKMDEKIDDPEVAEFLDRAASDPDPALRRSAILALGVGAGISKHRDRARQVLQRALWDADPDVREAALWALEQVGDPSQKVNEGD